MQLFALALYGHTSGAGGTRLSLTHNSEPVTLDDAHFMVVVCFAFADYQPHWTCSRKLVGAPRFDPGTPCTP